MNILELKTIVTLLMQGAVIAYPTEGVFGLGCDPLNQPAVQQLLSLKARAVTCGLIIIAANWTQLTDWIGALPVERLQAMQKWPSEVITWVVPASLQVPAWIRGTHSTVAVRVTQHPLAKAICAAYGAPIVSTSANMTKHAACLSYAATKQLFGEQIKFIVNAPVGGLHKPSKICDALSGSILRA